jgi:hypothetical protein
MASKGNVGPALLRLGIVLIIVSVAIFVCIVASIYLVTSYYEDWQRTLYEFDKGVFLVGVVTAANGLLVNLIQNRHGSKD